MTFRSHNRLKKQKTFFPFIKNGRVSFEKSKGFVYHLPILQTKFIPRVVMDQGRKYFRYPTFMERSA